MSSIALSNVRVPLEKGRDGSIGIERYSKRSNGRGCFAGLVDYGLLGGTVRIETFLHIPVFHATKTAKIKGVVGCKAKF